MKTMYKSMNINKLKLEEYYNKQIPCKQQENWMFINDCYEQHEEKERLNIRISDLDADIKRYGIQWKAE